MSLLMGSNSCPSTLHTRLFGITSELFLFSLSSENGFRELVPSFLALQVSRFFPLISQILGFVEHVFMVFRVLQVSRFVALILGF